MGPVPSELPHENPISRLDQVSLSAHYLDLPWVSNANVGDPPDQIPEGIKISIAVNCPGDANILVQVYHFRCAESISVLSPNHNSEVLVWKYPSKVEKCWGSAFISSEVSVNNPSADRGRLSNKMLCFCCRYGGGR